MPYITNLQLLAPDGNEPPAYTDDQRDSAAAGEGLKLFREYYPDIATDPDQFDSAQAQLIHMAKVWVRLRHAECPIQDVQARLAAIEVDMARLTAERDVLWEQKLAGCTEPGW